MKGSNLLVISQISTRGQPLPMLISLFHKGFALGFSLCEVSYLKLGAAAAESLQSCPTLRDSIGGSPWDSPGKNTGVGCHFLLQCMHVCKVAAVVSRFCDPMDSSPPGSSIHRIL